MKYVLGALVVGALVGFGRHVLARGGQEVTEYPHSPTMDFDWLPELIEHEGDPYWTPPGWRDGKRYACAAVYRTGRGKEYYLCRQF